jgi:hypothetical protein
MLNTQKHMADGKWMSGTVRCIWKRILTLSFSTSTHWWITGWWTSETVDFNASQEHRCRVSQEDRKREMDKEYFSISGVGILLYMFVQIYQPNRPHRIPIHSIYVLPPTPAERWNPTVGGQPHQPCRPDPATPCLRLSGGCHQATSSLEWWIDTKS